MERTVTVNNRNVLITGNWSLDEQKYIFKGDVSEFESKKIIAKHEYVIPIGAVLKFGKDIFEDEIQIGVIEEITAGKY